MRGCTMGIPVSAMLLMLCLGKGDEDGGEHREDICLDEAHQHINQKHED